MTLIKRGQWLGERIKLRNGEEVIAVYYQGDNDPTFCQVCGLECRPKDISDIVDILAGLELAEATPYDANGEDEEDVI